MTMINDPFDETDLTGGRWSHCQFASLKTLKAIASRDTTKPWAFFVWPEEGRFLRTGTFEFNDAHNDFQPIAVELTSARMLMTLHDAIQQPDLRERFKTWVEKSRGHFGKIWEITNKHVKITVFGATRST